MARARVAPTLKGNSMFRVLFINNHGQGAETLDNRSFDTEAAAEEVLKVELAVNPDYHEAVILRPIASFAPVTTIQRRPMNVQMASGGGGDA